MCCVGSLSRRLHEFAHPLQTHFVSLCVCKGFVARAPFFSFWRAANTHAQPTAAKETHTRTHSRAVTFGASIGTLQYQQPPHYTGGAVDNLASQKASQPASLLVSEPCQAAVAFAIGSSFKLSCIVSSTSSSPSPLPLLLHHEADAVRDAVSGCVHTDYSMCPIGHRSMVDRTRNTQLPCWARFAPKQ